VTTSDAGSTFTLRFPGFRDALVLGRTAAGASGLARLSS
jgi:hypothetical protein